MVPYYQLQALRPLGHFQTDQEPQKSQKQSQTNDQPNKRQKIDETNYISIRDQRGPIPPTKKELEKDSKECSDSDGTGIQ